MPIYLCQPGSTSKEPWRHGVQVYERPFPLYDESPPSSSAASGNAASILANPPQQIIVMANKPEKPTALRRYLSDVSTKDRVLIFCAKSIAHVFWAKEYVNLGFRVVSLHKDKTEKERGEIWGAFCSGKSNILLVVDGAEEIIQEMLQSTNNLTIHMVINFDLLGTDISTYLSRLHYTQKKMVSFFHTLEDGPKAKELVEVLRKYGQRVPMELMDLVPPPLLTPKKTSSGLLSTTTMTTTAAAGGQGAERGRPLRAIPLREDSHSPAPDHQHGQPLDDTPTTGATALEIATNEIAERRLRQRQFLENHNTTVSNSSDDESQPNNRDETNDTTVVTRSFHRSQASARAIRPNPVRRVRHAEVVLVDQCLVAYGIYWLRLQWPGEQGGFGGFVALSRVEDATNETNPLRRMRASRGELGADAIEGGTNDETKGDTPGVKEEEVMLCQEVGSAVTQTTLLCMETNVHYPTSTAMKLLLMYDDGLSGQSQEEGGRGMEEVLKSSMENGEPVFCRICREGLHDVNYDMETVPPSAAEGVATPTAGATAGGGGMARGDSMSSAETATMQQQYDNAAPSSATTTSLANLPPLILRHPTAENPLLAPCACTGTMAFVHYLCIEQWRCRSRHPNARNGLNCETCGAEYTLPPPPSRPASRHDIMNGLGPNGAPGGGGNMAEDDWLDAMPPHVLAALRRPHPAWQLGAAVVRRRWLRPVVPIIVSPLVALYCRARRTLKKRGVSRRRWACSLCRRRARWKCVRCLRSYYCSRQCQNVSWHIVHKHVCYKPVRFWWSVVVYTVGIFMAVPGIVENFPIYDAMVTLLPINFIALGIVGGGIASSLKRTSGIDIRGRILEIIVVLQTLLLTGVSSGLVRGYFGDASQCWGVFAPSSPLSTTMFSTTTTVENNEGLALKGPFYPSFLNTVLVDIPLKQIQLWYLKWDFILSKLGPLSRSFLCAPAPDGGTDYSTIGCSPSTRTIDPQFYLDREGGGRCSADMALVMGCWFMALGVLLLGYVYRQMRGGRRNNVVAHAGHAAHRGRRRPHQD